MGGKHTYNGAMGTSILRVFEAVAGITGLSLKQALAEGIPANAIVVHKEHHTSYYPGAENVSVMLVYNSETGAVLGGQTAGYKGADRRLDVIASAIAGNLTIHDLADIDFAYSPPLGTANDVINMAAYTAENQKSGFSPSITVGELDEWVKVQKPIVIDVRDMFSFEKGNIVGAYNVPLEMLHEELKAIPKDSNILVYDETGKKGHQALRMLKNSGVDNVYNISGGFISLQRQAYATGFQNFRVNLPKVEKKTVDKNNEDIVIDEKKNSYINTNSNTPLVVDVRTPMEFSGGAYPNAINISLDELETRIDELGSKDRDITLYCASGARSAYAQQLLRQMGYTNVKNGGGLMQMMRKR